MNLIRKMEDEMDRLLTVSVVLGFFILAFIPNIDSIVNSVILLTLAIFACLFSLGILASNQINKPLQILGRGSILFSIPLSVAFSYVMYVNVAEGVLIENTTRFTIISMSITILSLAFVDEKNE